MDRETARKASLGFGLFYLLIGVLGLVPGITVPSEHPGHGLLLGIFAVNALHNLVHLIAGAGAVYAGLSDHATAGRINWLLAAVFALLVPASLIAPLLEAVAINVPDTLLHNASAVPTALIALAASRAAAGRTTTSRA